MFKWRPLRLHNVHDKESIVSNKYSIVTVPTISNSIINFTMVVIRISLKMILEKNSRLFDWIMDLKKLEVPRLRYYGI